MEKHDDISGNGTKRRKGSREENDLFSQARIGPQGRAGKVGSDREEKRKRMNREDWLASKRRVVAENRKNIHAWHLTPLTLMERVNVTASGCWEWTGNKVGGTGYGQVYVKSKCLRAHRAIYEMLVGPIPDGLCVLHKCDNPPCVNPKHLFIGTVSDNQQDMMRKDRCIHGERHHKAKLNESDVLEMKRMRQAGTSYPEIGRLFKVSKVAARNAIIGKSWKRIRREQ